MVKNFIKEFEEFAVKGNVLDLAVGVIIGGAFGKIVSSLVADILTPTIGLLVGGINFTDLSLTFGSAKITYGNFLQSIFDFLIVAFSIFVFIRMINRFKRKIATPEEIQVIEASREEKLLTEIRDILKQK